MSQPLTMQSFEMYAGDSKRVVVPVTYPDSMPVDLTGTTIRWVVYQYRSQHVITKSTDSNGIVFVECDDNNEFMVLLTPDDTVHLSGTFKHMAEVVDNSGNISTILVGNITILPVPFTR